MTDFNARIIELAQAQAKWSAYRTELAEKRAELDSEIQNGDAALDTIEKHLREDLQQYFRDTGDRDVHPAVTFRVTPRLMYDKAEELARAKAAGRSEHVRIKEELDVRAFEKDYKAGLIPDAQVEEIIDVVVALGRLGEYVKTE
jgi:hypothetical protein